MNSVGKTFTSAMVLGWGMVLLFVVLNMFGALLLKNQIQKLGNWNFASIQSTLQFFLKLFSSFRTLLAVGSLFGSTIAWSLALANLELSRAYPVAIGLNFLIVMISTVFFYGESLDFSKISGLFLILTGIVVLLR